MKKLSIVLMASLFLLGGLATQVRAEKVTFLLDWIIYGKHAPFYVASDKGFYKKYGLDVTYRRGFGSGDTIKKVGAKVAPLGFADIASLVPGRANSNLPVKALSVIHAKTIMVVAFMSDKPYKTPQDLANVKIGSPQGNAVRIVWPAFAAINKIPGKVQWIDMGYGAVLPSLLKGNTDAALWFATELPTAIPKAKKMGKDIKFFSLGDYGVEVYNNAIIAREDTISSKPKMVKNVVHALMDAFGWSMLHADEAVNGFRKHAPGMSPSIIHDHFATMIEYLWDDGTRHHGLGYMGHAKMDNTVTTMTKLLKLKRRVPTGNMYTNKFLPQWPTLKATLGDKVQ